MPLGRSDRHVKWNDHKVHSYTPSLSNCEKRFALNSSVFNYCVLNLMSINWLRAFTRARSPAGNWLEGEWRDGTTCVAQINLNLCTNGFGISGFGWPVFLLNQIQPLTIGCWWWCRRWYAEDIEFAVCLNFHSAFSACSRSRDTRMTVDVLQLRIILWIFN